MNLVIQYLGGSLLTVFSTPAASYLQSVVFIISWIQSWRDKQPIITVQQHIVMSPTA